MNQLLLFDGVCNLCNRFVLFVIRFDKRKKIKFASLQSEAGREALRKINLPSDHFDSFIYIADNRYYSKSSAGLHLLRDLGGLWLLLYPLILIPKFVRDYFYDVIAHSRYKILGRRETCMMPTADIKERFID
jgi:predicted DCC family thiol-disulfide oxidoreductase YuxK